MTKRDLARLEVYQRFKASLTPDRHGRGYICPICGNGTGKTGTGMMENIQSQGHYSCRKGNCIVRNMDAFDILAVMNGWEDLSPGQKMVKAYEYYGLDYGSHKKTPEEGDICTSKPLSLPLAAPSEPLIQSQYDYTNYFRRCRQQLVQDDNAKAYLQSRGISLETARSRWVGFDPQWRSPAALRRGSKPWATPRIILPTSPYSYIARDIRPPTPKNEGYAKMKEGKIHFFGLKILKKLSNTPFFVVEGEFDALSIIEVGGNAVALGSTNNVDKFLQDLKALNSPVPLIISTDNDDAGKEAAQTLTDGLTDLNIPNTIINVSGNYNDPNEALSQNRKEFQISVKNAINMALKP